MNIVLIYATAPDAVCAKRLCQTLVEERLVACGNILSGLHSVYRWQGEVECADEVGIILKTTARRVRAALRRLHELHPYEEPPGVVVPASAVLPGFGDWITASVRPKPVRRPARVRRRSTRA